MKCSGPANGTRFDSAQSIYPTTTVIMNNKINVKCQTETIVNSSLKHGGGQQLPDGTMLIKSVTEETVVCPAAVAGILI